MLVMSHVLGDFVSLIAGCWVCVCHWGRFGPSRFQYLSKYVISYSIPSLSWNSLYNISNTCFGQDGSSLVQIWLQNSVLCMMIPAGEEYSHEIPISNHYPGKCIVNWLEILTCPSVLMSFPQGWRILCADSNVLIVCTTAYMCQPPPVISQLSSIRSLPNPAGDGGRARSCWAWLLSSFVFLPAYFREFEQIESPVRCRSSYYLQLERPFIDLLNWSVSILYSLSRTYTLCQVTREEAKQKAVSLQILHNESRFRLHMHELQHFTMLLRAMVI